jgi:uncharacterized protein YwlG (UPF0340 family)
MWQHTPCSLVGSLDSGVCAESIGWDITNTRSANIGMHVFIIAISISKYIQELDEGRVGPTPMKTLPKAVNGWYNHQTKLDLA